MQSNYFDSTILGTINHGQAIAVDGMHRATLREMAVKFARLLSLRLGAWRALAMKRALAGMTPATATCPSYSASRRQRDQRWMSGVVVDPGTVGVR
jgi:hypothetical protein